MPLNSEILVSPGPYVPAGYVIPVSGIDFGVSPFAHRTTIDLDAVTYDDPADPVAAFTNIVAAVKTEMDTNFLPNSLKLDIVTPTVTAVYTINNVVRQRNQTDPYIEGAEVYKVNTSIQYV